MLGDQIAKNLERLLDEKGLKPTPLSLKAKLSRTAISDIISRKTKNPTYASLVKIANAAGVDVMRIIDGPDYTNRSKDDLETISLVHQLTQEERATLKHFLKAQIAGRGSSQK